MCDELKKCSKCDGKKPLESFSKNKNTNDGLQYICKECVQIYKKEYNISNQDAIKEKNQLYYKRNREQIKKSVKEWTDNNKSKKFISHKQWCRSNKDRVSEYQKRFSKANPHKRNAFASQRRAMKLNQLHPNHNKEIEKTLYALASRVTKCIGITHHVDHVWPLAQGGLHHHCNLQVISQSLNCNKGIDMCMEHQSLAMWYELPEWLIRDTVNWK